MTENQPTNPGPLAGIRVLDLSGVVMGPVATRTLGDLGADVIAVETAVGDRNRSMGIGPHPELSGVALNLMRNKRSIGLDCKAGDGRQAFLDLAATCDVMVTNLRPGPLARLGLDYPAVKAVRPNVVFCQAHGFPSDSDQADAPAYDDIIQSGSGFGDLFRLIGNEPFLVPTLVADKVCGMAIANAVLAALYHRSVSGHGQHIEIPMIDIMTSFMLVEHGAAAIPEPKLGPAGYARILTDQRRPQPTADGFINILPYDRRHYVALFAAGGRNDLVDDPRFATGATRIANSDTLYRDVASILPQRTTTEWLAFCAQEQIPAAEAASLDDLVAELAIEEHPVAGAYRVIPPPERFSATPASIRAPAPVIGQHGREVLAEVGYSPERIDALEMAGVLHVPSGEDR